MRNGNLERHCHLSSGYRRAGKAGANANLTKRPLFSLFLSLRKVVNVRLCAYLTDVRAVVILAGKVIVPAGTASVSQWANGLETLRLLKHRRQNNWTETKPLSDYVNWTRKEEIQGRFR